MYYSTIVLIIYIYVYIHSHTTAPVATRLRCLWRCMPLVLRVRLGLA